jgi:hypothetical protein
VIVVLGTDGLYADAWESLVVVVTLPTILDLDVVAIIVVTASGQTNARCESERDQG